MKDTLKEAPKPVESNKATPPKEAPKEGLKEKPKETPKEAPKEVPKKEIPKDVKDVPRFPKDTESKKVCVLFEIGLPT